MNVLSSLAINKYNQLHLKTNYMKDQSNNVPITRRKLLQIGGSVGVVSVFSGCLGETEQPSCTGSNAVIHYPHNMFVVSVTSDGKSNAERLKDELLQQDYHAETRPSVNINLGEAELERGDGIYLFIVGDFQQADIESILEEENVEYEKIRNMDNLLQRAIEDFPNYDQSDMLTQRFEYVTEDLTVQSGLELPELKKTGEYIEIVSPESDEQINEIKSIFEPRGRVEMKLSSQSLGDGVSTFDGNSEGMIDVGVGPLSSDEWRVEKTSISIVHTSEDTRAVVFQMDDNGRDYGSMLLDTDNPENEELEVYIDDTLLYSRPLTPQEKNPPEGTIGGAGEFGAIQMQNMSTLDAARLATVLGYPAKTPWPGKNVCE